MSNNICAVYIHQSHEDESELLLSQRKQALSRIKESMGEISLFSNRPAPGVEVIAGSPVVALKNIMARLATAPEDSVAVCYDFYPLLDGELYSEFRERHFKYIAQYSYSENIPEGLLPELISQDFFRQLGDNQPEDLREYIKKNINEYDVEVFYKLPDLRRFRLQLTTATERSRHTISSILELKGEANFNDLTELINSHPELLRPFPAYFEVELSTQSPVNSELLPTVNGDDDNEYLPVELFEKLLSEIESDGFVCDATLTLGGRGEPLTHPQFYELLSAALPLAQVKTIFLESYGHHLNSEAVERLKKIPGVEKLKIIIRLPTLQEARYQELYGSSRLALVLQNIELIEKLSELPFELYVELQKIEAVEDEIEAYFDRFEKSPFQVILQKYNTFLGALPERRVSDLTPLHRDFCWHLARDFFLNVNGRSPLCRQDQFGRRGPQFDFGAGSLRQFLESTMVHHSNSVCGKHGELPLPCLECDEWYTFNA